MADQMRTDDTNSSAALTPALGSGRLSLILGALLLGLLLAALDQTVVATALPTIVGDLAGLTQLSWVVTGYLLTSTASTPLWGKLGDLYGRKGLFQLAIVLFLAGSALAGLSRNMPELIAFRALQGIGGGGLFVTSLAIVADVVSPRELGRYQGIFGAVFGLTSVVGPLIGGFLVDALSWRWVFYVNMPVGAIALMMASAALPAACQLREVTVDYPGAALVAAAATALVLLTTLGGTVYPWVSPPVALLAALALVLVVALVWVERGAAEPVLPLDLFGNRVFAVTSGVGFATGFAMFGAISFLPLFLQVVQGASPTGSGLQLLPMTAGLLLTGILSGQLVSRWGRYRIFPIVGTAVYSLGLFLLSGMDERTSPLTTSTEVFVLGLGIGLVIQVLVIAVQNAVPRSELGVATSGATLFRSLGAAFGVAVFGAIFNGALAGNLRAAFSSGSASAGADLAALATAGQSPAALQALPAATHAAFIHAYALSLQPVYLGAAAIGLVAFGLTWLIREVPLRAGAPSDTTAPAASPDVQSSAGSASPRLTES